MTAALSSPTVEYSDYWDWFELACAEGWTDGLPLAPPTEERVGAIVEHLGRPPDEVVAVVPPKMGLATVEQLAIQCAMAGCLPEHVPIVVAALEAMTEPDFNLQGVQCTTNPCAPLTIVSGPVVERLGFNPAEGCFGGGARANAAVGRGIRLVLWNIGGGVPGQTDMATLGMPGKYAFCVAEHYGSSPWTPIHSDFGLPEDADAVTVFACSSPEPIFVPGAADRILAVLASTLPTTGINMFHAAGQLLVTIGLKPTLELAGAGHTKEDVRRWLFEHARYELGHLRRSGALVETEAHQTYWGYVPEHPDLAGLPDETLLPLVERAEDIHILVAGGESQWWAGLSPGWGNYGGYARSRAVATSGSAG
ncbi:MAG TPA: hypothetical protein VJT84_05525 [Gaiellaceae bacterium]|nr:hypothetical protein [Gaiellaceae bacterium]